MLTPGARRAASWIAATTVASAACLFVAPQEGLARPITNYPSDCASSSARVISGPDSSTLNLNSTGVVRITGTGNFTGGLGSYPAGALICVDSGGRFAPSWASNPNGTLAVAAGGGAVLSYLSVGTTFLLLNEGTTSVTGSFNVNGAGYLHNATGGTLTSTGYMNLGTGAVLENEGTATLQNLTLNQGSRVRNGGTLDVSGSLESNGTFVNMGTVSAAGLTTNSGAPLTNQCVIKLSGDWSNNSTATNSGMILLSSSRFTNNGFYRQDVGGLLASKDLVNNRSVTGFGHYRFTGNATTQGSFVGDDPASPVLVDSAAPAGKIFDLANGAVANTVRGTVDVDPNAVPAGCTDRTPTTADLVATKTGPATVDAGGTVTYTLTLSNLGPAAAADTVLTDRLPGALTGVQLSDGGTLSGSTATWRVGSLASGAKLTRTVTAAAPASGTFTDTVSATTSTTQSATVDSDGSSEAANVTTAVVPAPPVNRTPTTGDQQWTGAVNNPQFGALSAADPDDGQELRWAVTAQPAHGTLDVRPDGTFTYQPDQDWTGRDRFTARVCDNGSPVLCADATTALTVAPYTQDVSATTYQGEAITVPLTVNDVGQATAPTLLDPPANGTAVLDGKGGVSYTPAAGFLGTDTFRYQVCSANAADVCVSAQVSVTVVPKPKAPPAADALTVDTLAGQPVSAQVPATAADSGQSLAFSVLSGPARGDVVLGADGSFTYTPRDTAATGRDRFAVSVCDATSSVLCTVAEVTVLIHPSAVADAGTATSGTAAVFDIAANDIGDAGPAEIIDPPTLGTATVADDGTVHYTATGTGEDSLVYRRCTTDGTNLCTTATLTIAVGAPTRVRASGTALEGTVDQPLTGMVTAASTSGRPVAYSITAQAANGTGSIDATTGAVTYTPNAGFIGSDVFAVTSCDGAICDTAQVTVAVRPLAAPGRIATTAGQGAHLSFDHVITGTDPTVTAIAQPAHGSVQLTSSDFVYVPADGFAGTDSFTYRACSTSAPAVCAEAEVLIWVAPLANGAAVTTTATDPVTVDATANDIGVAPDSVPLIVTAPEHGTAIVLADGRIRYTPTGTWTGTDSLVYEVSGATTSLRAAKPRLLGAREAALTARASVLITVVPKLAVDRARTTEGKPVTIAVGANDVGDADEAVLAQPPTRGTVEFRSGQAIYTPLPGFTGEDSFTYRRCSTNAPDVCATALVTVEIDATPTPPPTPSPSPTPSPTAPPTHTPTPTDQPPHTPSPDATGHGHGHGHGPLADTGQRTGYWALLLAALGSVAAGLGVIAVTARTRGRH
ncbi:Ig-like domain-containing protein [Streptomyces sp. NPDC050738]|uniref:Ig-like domain-containing protein n=1 Tax=Streptomyces sp. NPDC050738 TaxID=3154744 RepID=UPI0034483A0E